MDVKHTPGPWVAFQYFGELAVKWQGLPFVKGTPEANARLITACPTMFDYVLRKSHEGDADAAAIIASIEG